jgi:glycosyltransferase involved in cell wall biosynthesis
MSEEFEVIFLDCIRRGQQKIAPKSFSEVKNLAYETYYYPYRNSGLLLLLIEKLRQFISRTLFVVFGFLHPSALSTRAMGIEKKLKKIDADIYIGHNIDALLPISRVSKANRASMIFDCMEFYSDMGDSQNDLDRAIIRTIERKCLRDCELVLASSEKLAEELAKVYGIKKPLALYNTPEIEVNLQKKNIQFSLYWRNSTIGLGQRGLGDALAALKLLPEPIKLNIQGRMPFDGGTVFRQQIKDMGLLERVVIHPPYLPHEAVKAASHYTIGLCLERKGNRNHDLTVSNKLFDYHMAGLSVVASDLPGIRDVVTRSGGGLLFKSGCPEDLADKIAALYGDKDLLKSLASQARSFALTQGNVQHEMEKFKSAFMALFGPRINVSNLSTNAASLNCHLQNHMP